ncbi:MAG: glycosyltransferase [Muribaculaceae bacterium]|nr:glycosyltransferase [Muribaculaceae bacterium]
MAMKIALVTTSVQLGGAAIASGRLAEALRARGEQVEVFSLDGKRRERTLPFIAERAKIFLANGLNRNNLFKVSTASDGQRGLVDHIKAYGPDIIVLGWINQGMLSLNQIQQLGEGGTPIVWMMHDMWNLTGICHHSLGCMHFVGECGRCPMLSKSVRGENDLSHKVWLRKRRLYQSVKIQFVSVSNWLAELSQRSKLLEQNPPVVIPNVFPMDDFFIGEKERGLIVFGAARLDDPIKGLHHGVNALNRLSDIAEAHVVFFGELRNPGALSGLKIPYDYAGSLEQAEVARLMSRAEVILSSSLYETLPTTLIEGQASGAMPVSFDRGGQRDIIEHHRTGYLAPFGDEEALARGIRWALESDISPENLRAEVDRKFSAGAVAKRMIELFETLKKGQLC